MYSGLGSVAAERIGTSGASMGDEFIVALLEDLAHLPETVIVLDDVEAVRNGALLDELAVLVEQAPPSIHIVLASRSDPPLPLHRLRVNGDLAELRQDQLKMSEADASERDPPGRPHDVGAGPGPGSRPANGRMARRDPDGRALATRACRRRGVRADVLG